MNISVCVKVIDGELNPFDACAVECALRLGGNVTVVSMCPPSAENVLKPLTRLGVNKVILLSDKAFAGSDTLATAYILSCALKRLKPGLVICGRQSIDGDTAQVGPCLSVMLKYNLITNVMDMDCANGIISCKTRLGNDSAKLPALITVERINELRFPRMGSKISNIEIWDNSVLQADAERCGLCGSPTRVIKTFASSCGKRRCKFISPSEFYPLIEKLKKSKKADLQIKPSECRLPSVTIFGKEALPYAEAIADEVIVKERGTALEIYKFLKSKKPETVLFPADLWGRKTAPQVSALLNTGLCADCTALDTDGKRLIMYRPAQGGNIVAEIICKTNPQMATVRTEEKCSDIAVSGGRGIIEHFDMLAALSEKLNGEICASRAAVDAGAAPYSAQVGLTGKKISPLIYIAAGISGAVHHTCAIEGAKWIIAVNPDKKARIFDYADYGIICNFEDLF